ncbi:phytase [Sphingomonas melonis]
MTAGARSRPSDTDGIKLVLGDFGLAYPADLFVAQDGDNVSDTQNFECVSWAKVSASARPVLRACVPRRARP